MFSIVCVNLFIEGHNPMMHQDRQEGAPFWQEESVRAHPTEKNQPGRTWQERGPPRLGKDSLPRPLPRPPGQEEWGRRTVVGCGWEC